jgi:hypothetical protein
MSQLSLSRVLKSVISGEGRYPCSALLRCRSTLIYKKHTLSEDGELKIARTSAHKLMKCRYDAEGRNKTFQAYSNASAARMDGASNVRPSELKTIGQAKDENLGMSDNKTDYFTTQATIAFIKQETFSYPACANPDGCNKKVVDSGSGWTCDKCDKTWDEPIHR